MSEQRLPVVLMWHMHQPQYRDAFTGEDVQPWTTLHALKDYSDMAAHLEDNPAARAVINFAPILIEQIERLAVEIAAHLTEGAALHDPVLALLGDAPLPTDLSHRLELMRALLRAQRVHMIEPLPAFAELVTLAREFATPERIAYASDDFLRDLAVWYHLAWTGETVRRADPRVAALMARGRAFHVEARRTLLELIGETVGSLVPRYRALATSGQVEIALSPYAHPLVPLLCDFRSARDAWPDSSLPRSPRYPGGRERAEWHFAAGIEKCIEAFGRRPTGCWPSEGAISGETLELIDAAGFDWYASSAGVLRNSLLRTRPGEPGDDGAELFNRPWRVRGGRATGYFRHDTLSDLIGFTYGSWHGDDAVGHFVHEIERLAARHPWDPARVLLVALDGENAWEHYPQNGFHFLRGLYERLAAHPSLELTTLSDVRARDAQPLELDSVVAGSWVHGTLSTWIGDADKNAAWDVLCEAKREFDRVVGEGALDAAGIEAATRQLALCESSDWFWWFGDYNPPDAVDQFDRLYRRQLATLYRLLGLAPPDTLSEPLALGRGSPEQGGVMRRAHA